MMAVKFQEEDYGVSATNLSVLLNRTADLNDTANYLPFDPLTGYITSGFLLFISLLGLLSNGAVIWLLAFHIQRSPFTIYILNLSIADFGVLISLVNVAILGPAVHFDDKAPIPSLFFLSFFELFFFTFSAGQFLLLAISLDRCVAAFFPLWYQCRLSPYLSTLVCALIWILSFLLSGIHFILRLTRRLGGSDIQYQLILSALFCNPCIVLFALALFIRVCRKPQEHQHRRHLTIILLVLLCCLLLSFPLDVFYAVTYFSSTPHNVLKAYGLIGSCAKSSANPLIYFRVGWIQEEGQPKCSMKTALQRVFEEEEEEDGTERQRPTTGSPLLKKGLHYVSEGEQEAGRGEKERLLEVSPR